MAGLRPVLGPIGAAELAVAGGVGATTAYATAGTGAALGVAGGVANTYASNPDAGFHEYAFNAGMGGAFGAFSPTSAGGSLVGGGIGAGTAHSLGYDWKKGYQIGDLAGGIASGGLDDGIRASW